jgi:hypothetical protein
MMLADVEKDQAAIWRGRRRADLTYLDAHPEVERREFEFVRGAWSEQRPRS